ncbi:MAG TPA: hypothetical protein VK797_06110 [Tepidisphaeraceae bacterium]|jgi:hypothetical protein|nr:hypothetical protein [Tepidisphaeraceae bacterium]
MHPIEIDAILELAMNHLRSGKVPDAEDAERGMRKEGHCWGTAASRWMRKNGEAKRWTLLVIDRPANGRGEIRQREALTGGKNITPLNSQWEAERGTVHLLANEKYDGGEIKGTEAL